jgi:hypothetical protein
MEAAMIDFESGIFQDILSDIERESCVLIIGPDLVDFGDKSFFEILCEELQKDAQYSQLVDLSPQHVFFHEELLQLKPSAKETTLLRYMERFYQRQVQYDEPFRKIAQIPFHLIVSFLPDTRLKKIYEDQNLDFKYSHYPREENPANVEKPTKKTPLVYNILGDFSEGDVIITFDHLFQYLSGIMGRRELPHAIQEAFKKARTFLFLGVHFERWYVQLILRIITTNTKDKKEKYSILKNDGSSEVYMFMARRLELDFVEIKPIDFLDQLYEECAAHKLLKMPRKAILARVFISYSHQDKAAAMQVREYLRHRDIDVVIDEEAMPGGQKIEEFVKTVSQVDCVLAIISKNSLLSPWVSREIMETLQKTRKYFMPCCLDDSFMDKGFMGVAEKFVDEKLAGISENIRLRGRGNTDDLFNERNRWTEYISVLPTVLNELNLRKCISLKPEEFDGNIVKIADNILSSK